MRDYQEVIRRLLDYGRRNVIPDYPRLFKEDGAEEPGDHERSLHGQILRRSVKLPERTFQPFDHALSPKSYGVGMWLNQNLSVQVIDCWRALKTITELAVSKGMPNGHPPVVAERQAFLSSVDWRDSNGDKIVRLRFEIKQRTNGMHTQMSRIWPPANAGTTKSPG